jgi:hypothetical protein
MRRIIMKSVRVSYYNLPDLEVGPYTYLVTYEKENAQNIGQEIFTRACQDYERVNHSGIHLPCLLPTDGPLADTTSASSQSSHTMCPAVLLGDEDTCPKVMGKPKPLLTVAQFDTVKAMLQAMEEGRSRLTGPELDELSGHPESRKYLKQLARSDPDWEKVLLFPLHKGRGYGIAER